MSENDIFKSVASLKTIAVNIGSMIDYLKDHEDIMSALQPYIDEMNKGCSVLTEIFEKTFTDMIAEKERMEDDGK